jgi:AraC-like DNA-binding protein
MDPVPIKLLRFSTDDFPEHKRIDAYREIYSRTIVKHDVEPIGDQPFRFKAELCSLPGLGLASCFYSPCYRWHTAEHIDSDDLLFGVALHGGCVLHQRGREAVIGGRGEAVLASAAHPVDLDACNARRIPGNAGGLSLLIGYVGALRLGELTKPADRDLVVSHVYDLVALLLGAKGDARHSAQQGGARAARLAAIMREIEHRSGDPGLSATTIALLLGITPRYVHLLLEESGKSFTHHVVERRLEKAAALLRDPHWRHRKIADIAAEAGFVDLSYFNRTFRRRYGATPSDMREAARRQDRD